MTENNKPETRPDNDTDSAPAIEKKTSKPSFEGRKTHLDAPNKTLPFVAVGLSVVALACSGWLYFQSTQHILERDIQTLSRQQAQFERQLDTNATSRAQLNQLTEQVQRSIQAGNQQNRQLVTQLAQQDEKVLALETKLSRLNNTTKEDWKLAEAEYLIRLANQRLLLESDSDSAATLLINADDILNELEDPITFDTRKALAKDIQALKSISQFDLEGAYLKLNALYDSVTDLPQREPSKEWQDKATDNTQATVNTDTTHMMSVLNSFWDSLRSLVVINYNHKPINALLPPAEYQQLIAGIQLQLDIAQVALIKGEPVIYQQALSRIANAITVHFDTESNTVTSFLSSLTALQQLNPSPNLPLPRDSLMAMKSLMQEWNSRRISAPETSAPEIETKAEPVSPSVDVKVEVTTKANTDQPADNLSSDSEEPIVQPEEALKPATEEQTNSTTTNTGDDA
ncbi:uroporphyrinogen-III C-methyltransferase [Marinomonas sp. A79]|uniref:Uroporphyrinogen-III C-methyltransferase n=1 Tax=Marinomonas vulgaris TaxID=2823372 RepID=A0ABS5HEE1_9GAMM|nr:uroporphyrinogen-III C-methyltransferase [Marinomonas vulgaris]MBR7890003.1 uroporphyrinogen-III C-methyltransferase [Marinomonas vulgaris]